MKQLLPSLLCLLSYTYLCGHLRLTSFTWRDGCTVSCHNFLDRDGPAIDHTVSMTVGGSPLLLPH